MTTERDLSTRRHLHASSEEDELVWQQLTGSSCWYRVRPGPKLSGSFPRLRDYQEMCIQAMLDKASHGHSNIGVAATTGAGKTFIMLAYLSMVPDVGSSIQTFILLPTPTLVDQTLARVRETVGTRISVGVEQGGREAVGTELIVLANRNSVDIDRRIQKFEPQNFKLVFCDEAHHASANSWLRILHYFNAEVDVTEANKVEKRLGPAVHDHQVPIVGVSGTLAREDGRLLGWVFRTVIDEIDMKQLIKDSIIADIAVQRCREAINESCTAWRNEPDAPDLADDDEEPLEVEINEVPAKRKPRTMARYQTTPHFGNTVVEAFNKYAKKSKSVIVFANRVKGVRAIESAFKRAKIDAVGLVRKKRGQPPGPRDQDVIARFKNGEIRVLVNCCKLLEGFDHPKIDCVIMARRTTSRNLNVQILGRGRRMYAGKKACTVIDMFGNCDRWGLEVKPCLL